MNPFNLNIQNPIKSQAPKTYTPSPIASKITSAIGNTVKGIGSFLSSAATPKVNASTTNNPITTGFSQLSSGYKAPTLTSIGSFGQYSTPTPAPSPAKQASFIPNQYTPIPKTSPVSQINTDKFSNMSINPDIIKNTTKNYETPIQSTLSNTGFVLDEVASQEPVNTTNATTQTPEQKYIDRLLSRDIGAEKSQLRETADIQTKQIEYNNALNSYKKQKQTYEDKIEKMRENKSGMSSAVLNAEIEEYTRKANKDLANIAVGVELLKDNYEGAEKILNAQIDDLQSSFDNELKTFQVAMDFLNNDLTESEKMQAEQAFELRKIDYENQIKDAKTQSEDLILQSKANNYQKMLENGTITADKIPQDVMAYIDATGYQTPEQKAAKANTLNRLDTMLDLTTKPLGTAVGPGIQQIFGKVGGFVGLGSFEARRKVVDNLIANVTLDVLPALKGPTSDKDIVFITDAASALNPNSSEKEFKAQIQILADKITTGVINSTAYTPEEKISVAAKNFKIKDPKATPDQITEMIKQTYPDILSFNTAGNASASKIANAIKKVESNGNYAARGASGEFGAYQFMPATWKQWAGEFLGDTNARPTKGNQDFVAQSKINQLINQGYNPEEIALIWNGGTPIRKKGINQFGVKYDSGAYAQKVIKQLNS